jgi:histidyl-tRNA synthetase
MVVTWSQESAGDSLALAADLRRAGLRVDVYPEADKPGKQLKYAASRSYHVVAIVGDDERQAGMVAVKNLRSGRQTTVGRAETAERIQAELQETGKDLA